MSNPIKEESINAVIMVPIEIGFHSESFDTIEEWVAFKTRLMNDPDFRKAELMKVAENYVYDICNVPQDITNNAINAINDDQVKLGLEVHDY